MMRRYVNDNKQKLASVNTAGEVDELNQFFNRFDCHDFTRKHGQVHDVLNSASAEEADVQKLHREDEIRRAFQHVTPSKTTGPDNIATTSAEQLASIFFPLYLMPVSSQILFQLLGSLHALCL